MNDVGDGVSEPPTRRVTPRLSRSAVAAGLFAIAGTLALVAVLLNRGRGEAATQPDVADVARQVATDVVTEAQAAPERSAVAYRAILPSIVVVRTDTDRPATPGSAVPTAPDGVDDPDGPRRGLGTGVVIDDTGTVLTALHVVDGATNISVGFADGTEAQAEVIASDPARDIAVLTVDQLPEILVPAVMGGGLTVGDEVFAVGHPMGLTASLSAGVVSALDRSIPTSAGQLDGLIQFDAAANPGNSGGPLLDRNGHVVGIVTALANPAEQPFFVGIGFAVPIASAGGVAGGPSQ